MDTESGESNEQDDVTGVGRDESEMESLGWGWWREAESWFQRQGETYPKEQWVVRNRDEVDERVWQEMKRAPRRSLIVHVKYLCMYASVSTSFSY